MTGPVWAYLGPEATFAEAALRLLPGADQALLMPQPTVGEALDAVRSGDAELAVVPYENSLEGSVAGTIDDLADQRRDRLVITAEVLLPVSFALLVAGDRTLAEVTEVITIPAAEAQCRAWLRANLPGVPVRPASSTAEAARAVALGAGQPEAPGHAAIASAFAGMRYGLRAVATELERAGGSASPVTRFVAVSRPRPSPPPSGADRTTVVLFERDDHPGALLEILTEFAVRGVNLTRLESRPTGAGLGNYCFVIDLDGHLDEPRVGEALSALHRVCSSVLFLGSYAKAGSAALAPERPATTAAAFEAAADWLATLRRNG